MAENDCCQEEILDLKGKINNYVLKCTELKVEYKNLLIENLKKDVKIRDLRKELEADKFLKFKKKISANCLINLRDIGNSSKEDSTFVSCVMNDLYTLQTLASLTLGGRSQAGNQTGISAEVKDLVEKMFAERLSYVARQEVNDRRRNNLSKLIRNAIDSATKRMKDDRKQ